jgi:hypothetical protein
MHGCIRSICAVNFARSFTCDLLLKSPNVESSSICHPQVKARLASDFAIANRETESHLFLTLSGFTQRVQYDFAAAGYGPYASGGFAI